MARLSSLIRRMKEQTVQHGCTRIRFAHVFNQFGWGVEYRHSRKKSQRSLAQDLASVQTSS